LKSPMLITTVSAFSTKGQSFFKWLLTILGVEIVIGVVFAVVDFTKAPGLAPLALLTVSGLVALGIGKKKIGIVSTFLWVVLVIIFILILYPGDGENKKKQEDRKAVAPAKATYQLHDGYMVRTGEPQVVREDDSYKKISKGGNYIEIETNCVKFLSNIISINPGEKVKVMHINMFPYVRRNQCAYSITGDALSITGKRDRSQTTLPWIRENLPHPEFPAGVLVFYLKDSTGVIIKDYIKDEGDYVILKNSGVKEATLHATYNTPSQFKNQVGITGDTVTISVAVQK